MATAPQAQEPAVTANGHAHDVNLSKPDLSPNTGASQQNGRRTFPGVGKGPQVISTSDVVEVLCGPLLNYRHMSGENTDSPVWHGSVLIVTEPRQSPGDLSIGNVASKGSASATQSRTFSGVLLFEDPKKGFWQYSIDVPFLNHEATWVYSIPRMQHASDKRPIAKPLRFVVPSKSESFRILFHSCNGFSVGTDEEEWSGPALWNDVLRLHAERPFHVAIGGGDQIYNDSVRVKGPLRPWADVGNPIKRQQYPFTERLRAECDEYYFDNYVRWYDCEPFATANSQIAQVNIWDDHDIIDGFGSYTHVFMNCSVFRGIGGVAHKYYMLFQHHLPPAASTFTTDARQIPNSSAHAVPDDSPQLKDTFVMTPADDDPSYIIGKSPGPYVEERSRSIYCQLGKRVALLGIDARTERTRKQVNYEATYDIIFRHVEDKLTASDGAIKHFILLLGIPIAYPRLQWLENILQSPVIGPIRFLNRRFGLAGGFFNQFDGQPDLLDDLDDHYTAHHHKAERKELVLRLQKLSKRFGIRVTILGGDVHLAAMGRFYSKPHLNLPAERDWRYMPNVISSAITNHPPPQAVANLLARRNKIHHLDHHTDETLFELFDQDPAQGKDGIQPKAAASNRVTMPSRNYAVIAESHAHPGDQANGAAPNGHFNGQFSSQPNGHINSQTNGNLNGNLNGTPNDHPAAFTPPKNPREPLHPGEQRAGTSHPAASGTAHTGLGGQYGLDITYRVEIDHRDRQGRTTGYGMNVPALDLEPGRDAAAKR